MHAEAASSKSGGSEKQYNSHQNSQGKEREQDTTQTNNKNQGRDERIFSCPVCEQKLRVILPLPSNIGKCTKCHSNFKVSSDKSGNIYIYAIHDNLEKTDAALTIEECFLILDIKASATRSDIKRAYKIKMKEYHPDKVESLGVKLKDVANKESKNINAAFRVLQESGYC